MASRATDNLRTYFRKATLPEMLCDPSAPQMPPAGQRSQYVSVRVGHEPWRQLVELRHLWEVWGASLEEMTKVWADEGIPTQSISAEDMDEETGERFTVPCGPTFDIPLHVGRRPTDITRMIPWLDYLSLMTVQRMLHLVFPAQTADWSFSLVDSTDNKDRKVYQQFVWSYSGRGKPTVFTPLGNIARYPLVVAFQPPWILSAQDMLEFSECREFPQFGPSNAHPPALEAKERLWAKVWDTCVSHKTRWFVLTSYTHWIFGVFSESWTIGFASNVYRFDARDPTILELLAFWTAYAMRLPGWRGLPKIRETLTSGPPRIPATSS
ncbi:hypothetical protein C8F04DRAFT_1088557 [Mycena alexandri]|uniref:Uncharacterized protein n=1 Tax=Mycena alexandri TaxID=1745969 RepID=A0AAD6T3T8_9AGAR|nr:hypothetical protein C8F04DRAFT_1088557 [Mycena alexandri]